MIKGKRLAAWAAIILILAACFGIRAVTFRLPSLSEEEQDFFRDETGAPYLTELDSYYYLRLAREMSEGRGTFWYNHRLTDPMMGGRNAGDTVVQGDPMFLSVAAFWIWRVLSLFGKVSVIQVARWMGPVLGALAAVPAFLYVRKRTNMAGGVTAGLLAGLAVPFVGHTHGGFFDTDMLLAVLPLTMMTSLGCAMSEEKLRRQLLFGAVGAAAYGLISVTWVAYYMYFWLIVLGGLLGLLFSTVFAPRSKAGRKLRVMRGFGIMLGLTLALLGLIRGMPGYRALGGVFDTFRSVSGSSNGFPFTHAFTIEMNGIALNPDPGKAGILSLLRANMGSVLGGMGGFISIVLAAAAVPVCLVYARDRRKSGAEKEATEERIAAGIDCGMLIPWILIGIKLAVGSRRFIEVAVLPAVLLAGLAVGRIVSLIRNGKGRAVAAVLLTAAAAVPVALGAWDICRTALPSATDSREEAMAWIRENAPEDAAVASWWDDGYFIQYTARRRAIADGGTSSGVVNFFLSKALLTDDPVQMTGIFRMLETGSTKAVSLLAGKGFSDAENAALLLKISAMDREAAEAALRAEERLDETGRTALLDLTHPAEKRPLLLTLGSELLRKLNAIGYYGQWDPATKTSGPSLYWMVSDGTGVLEPGGTCELRMQDPAVVMMASRDGDGHVTAGLMKAGKPYRLSAFSVWKDGECLQDETLDGNGPALMLVEENGRIAAFSAHPLLHRSMLIRLLVAGDRGSEGIRLLGEWPGIRDDGTAMRRLETMNMADWAVQVWELDT